METNLSSEIKSVFEQLELAPSNPSYSTGTQWAEQYGGESIFVTTPISGKTIARVEMTTFHDYDMVVKTGQEAFATWRMMPAPKRGEIIRQIGLELRKTNKPSESW